MAACQAFEPPCPTLQEIPLRAHIRAAGENHGTQTRTDRPEPARESAAA